MDSELSTSDDMPSAEVLAAQERDLTLQPLTDNVKPDDLPDEQVVNQHLVAGPLVNLPIDTEQTHGELGAHEYQHEHARSGHIVTFLVGGAVVTILTVATYILSTRIL